MRLLYTLITLALGGGALFYWSDKNPQLKEKIDELILFRTTTAMEIRYGAEQIMEKEQKVLLREKGSRFLDPELTFAPYLLLHVKYHDGKKPKEGRFFGIFSMGRWSSTQKRGKKPTGLPTVLSVGARKTR